MINKLIKIANALDQNGLIEEADAADELISNNAGRTVYVVHSRFSPNIDSIWYSLKDAQEQLQQLMKGYYADDHEWMITPMPVR